MNDFEKIRLKYPGLLEEKQLAAIDRARKFLPKVATKIAEMNTALIEDNRLRVRGVVVTAIEAGMLEHELDCLVHSHDIAMKQWRRDEGLLQMLAA